MPVFEWCVEIVVVMCEEIADGAGPESPVFHAYFDLIGPVKFCFALRVSFSSVCVCAEFESACICNVREHDNLEFFPALVHLVVELVVFEEVFF